MGDNANTGYNENNVKAREEIGNKRRADLQSHHIYEQIDLGRKLGLRRAHEERKIEANYCYNQQELQEEIQQLNGQLEQPGFKGWLFHVTHGVVAKTQLEEAKLSYADGNSRISERRDAIADSEFVEYEGLQVSQRLESCSLERKILASISVPLSKVESRNEPVELTRASAAQTHRINR